MADQNIFLDGESAGQDVNTAAPRRLTISWSGVLFYVLLAAILVVSAWLRFDAQNWDDFTHLHPDERFLTTVITSLNGSLHFSDKYPDEQEQHIARCEQRHPGTSVPGQGERAGYFDADCSALNPNNLGHGTYVYGEFPLFTVHLGGVVRSELSRDWHSFLTTFDPDAAATDVVTTHWEGYNGAQFVGRSISATADLLTVFVVFLLARRLYGRWPGLLAAALYGLAAFPIQQSHFWTVDAFTTFWVVLALYFAVRVMDGAGSLQGPPVLVYLAAWMGGTAWEAAYHDQAVLGLLALGLIFVIVLSVAPLIGLLWGRALAAASGLIASVIYLIVVMVLAIFAPRAFPQRGELLELGIAGVVFGFAVLAAFLVTLTLRRQSLKLPSRFPHPMAVGALAISWLLLVIALVFGLLSTWPTLLVAAVTLALILFDNTELTDYALFGAAVGGAVASRINVAPLAGMIVIAAVIRALPALDISLPGRQRNRIVAYAIVGLFTAGVLAFLVFRILQPHAFLGPGFFGLKFNPGWREDISEANYYTSGDWDAPPNHQWADRTPYFFPWRNIVLWGLGIPLGLLAWAAWAWAGLTIIRGRTNWTRHLIPFVWIFLIFGWLGGRWVTTMRYFMPIYPALALFGAWALWAMITHARRQRSIRWRPLAMAGASILLVIVLGYTAVYGFAMHNIHRHQLTRVAASRWFQETVPGDMGIWIETADGSEKLVNIGRGVVAQPPAVSRIEQGETVTLTTLPDQLDPATGLIAPITVPGDARLTQITLHHLVDPLDDPDEEVVRVRLFRDDPNLGRQLVFQGVIRADLAANDQPYGSAYSVYPDEETILPRLVNSDLGAANYVMEVTALEGGPITSVRNITELETTTLYDMTLGLQLVSDGTLSYLGLDFEKQSLLTGYDNDIPVEPTHWTLNGSDTIPFPVPVDGLIRRIEIPHLGDPLRDAGQESLRLTVITAAGERVSTTITDDFNTGADPLGPARTAIFDPPLEVSQTINGVPQTVTLIVEALDPIYTSGPVVAWEGDWDDPVPTSVCPLPGDVAYSDDLPSGMSSINCMSLGMFSAYYQGTKLWMLYEDSDVKYERITNALDQADYIVFTSNRFYDSLTRIPMRWPMSGAFYEALFDERLGFELVKTFESPPALGPITFNDQILPTDDLPDWLNDHWEAEEAFHVYDHPAVLVFRKTADYSPENLRAVLDSVSRRPSNTANPAYIADPEPVGVVNWGAKQASQSPTMLQLNDEKWEIQQEGGTWSDLYDTGSLVNQNQIAAVIFWWLLIVIVGWLTWPLLFVSMPGLPDRGFPAAKITGWLIVAWVAWVGGTANLLTWTRSGLILILLGLVVLSVLVIWRRRDEFWLYIRMNRRHLLLMEGLGLVLYLALIGVRMGNPDLWHSSFGGEKPMDFAYFNAVLRSTVFPPIDPWFSGGYINYYYYGYVIIGAPVKILGIVPSLAYNLVLPALYSMTGTGVFSVAYNWVKARQDRREPDETAYVVQSYRVEESALPEIEKPFENPPSPALPPQGGKGEKSLPHFGGGVWGGGKRTDATARIASEPPVIVEIIGIAPPELSPIPPAPSGPAQSNWRKGEAADNQVPSLAGLGRGFRGGDEPRAPSGSAWLAGLIALVLAMVLGNLATAHLVFTDIARTGGYEGESTPVETRLAELEARRDQIFQDYYQEALDDFRDDNDGREPSATELNLITQEAQEATNDTITDSAHHVPLLTTWEFGIETIRAQMSAFANGIDNVLDGAPFPSRGRHRWYWAPTRVVDEISGAGPAIAEMPYFTFLYGDLHAHMIAMPITLLVLLWLLAEIIGAGQGLRSRWEAGLALGIGALAVGVLRPTNSWDWITYLILGVAGLTYVAWIEAARSSRSYPPSPAAARLWGWLRPRQMGRWWPLILLVPVGAAARIGFYVFQRYQADDQSRRLLRAGEELINPNLTISGIVLWITGTFVLAFVLYIALLIALRVYIDKRTLLKWIGRVGLFVGLTFVAGLPFTMYFASAYNSVKPWEGEHTPIWAYLYVHGLFLFIIVSFLIWQTARWLRQVRVGQLQGLIVPVAVIGLGMIGLFAGAVVYGVREVPVTQIVVPLVAWAGILFFLPRQNPLLRAIYALIVLALVITLGVEIIVLDGDIGRQNTVFKFYLQVWFILSIVGGIVLAWMLKSSLRWNQALNLVWSAALAILVMVALFYPFMATRARFEDRFNTEDVPLTLDGMDYMRYAIHGEHNVYFSLESDYKLIRWLQESVKGTPVTVEAHVYPSEYHWGGRISIYTGLPTLLGWRFHQIQQHSLTPMELLVQTRENNIAAFYEMAGSEGIAAAWNLIRFYDVEYIVVGILEHVFYDDIQADPVSGNLSAGYSPGLAKFDQMVELGLLHVVYEAPVCLDSSIETIEECPPESVYNDRIYRVVPGAAYASEVAAGE